MRMMGLSIMTLMGHRRRIMVIWRKTIRKRGRAMIWIHPRRHDNEPVVLVILFVMVSTARHIAEL